VFLSLMFLLGLLWGSRSTVAPSFESYALTNQRIIIRRDLFPHQATAVPIEALSKVRAHPHGRSGSGIGTIHLMMAKAGIGARRFEGSFGIKLPFFRAEGFVLHNVKGYEEFMKHLEILYPKTDLS